MNHLILFTEAMTPVSGGMQIQFYVCGTPKAIHSTRRMLPAHARPIEQSRDLKIESVLNDTRRNTDDRC